jgi:glycosyltransferase involved in cell wall biosynthesis
MRKLPFISVIIPLYNKEKTISDTLDSLLKQSFKDFDVIIIDDGSTDESVNIVSEFKDKRIRLIRKNNGGVSSARNMGLLMSKGEYIFFLDADDFVKPNCFSVYYELSKKYTDIKIFTTNFSIKDKVNIESNYCKRETEGIVENPFKEILHRKIYLRTGNLLINKNCFNDVGYFDECLSKYEDLDIIFRILEKYKVVYSPDVTFIYYRNFSELSLNKIEFNKEYASIACLEEGDIYKKIFIAEHINSYIFRNLFKEKDRYISFSLLKKHKRKTHFLILAFVFSSFKRLYYKIK